jgi:hypothetical protein
MFITAHKPTGFQLRFRVARVGRTCTVEAARGSREFLAGRAGPAAPHGDGDACTRRRGSVRSSNTPAGDEHADRNRLFKPYGLLLDVPVHPGSNVR